MITDWTSLEEQRCSGLRGHLEPCANMSWRLSKHGLQYLPTLAYALDGRLLTSTLLITLQFVITSIITIMMSTTGPGCISLQHPLPDTGDDSHFSRSGNHPSDFFG